MTENTIDTERDRAVELGNDVLTAGEIRPRPGTALVRHLRRPQREGRFFLPGQALETERQMGLSEAPGLRAVGKVVSVGSLKDDSLVGKYVVLRPDGGRGAFHRGRYAFYLVATELLGVVEDGEG